MKDIRLCKAKRVDNREWVIGYYVMSSEKHYIICSMQEKELFGKIELFPVEWYEIDEKTLCRNTGLLDKHQDIIWEHDIVRNLGYSELCIVNQHKGDWIARYNPQTPFYDYNENAKCTEEYPLFCVNLGFYVVERNAIERVGNIFDNTELLSGGAG